ncbi:3-deoxy-manno-octulosonate cytidylyltransferase [Achromatium sp. WMS2]|nr:3-deoxy-manno-octulosonate cytidylyltransferase [Achromatium sp. WMS2]
MSHPPNDSIPEFRIVIPARYASTRLPGKPLLAINGKPMLWHVYNRACASAATEVVIATDDNRIAEVATAFGATVCMTSSQHNSGSERIAEVIAILNWPANTYIVNLQGDEPCMPYQLLNQVAHNLHVYKEAAMTTLATPIFAYQAMLDPNVVKVVLDTSGYAMYFSRAPIPWRRGQFDGSATVTTCISNTYRHIGLYAYRANFLQQYLNWPATPLEQMESLEQLRVLWYGQRIHVGITNIDLGPGVDVADDIRKVEQYLNTH